METQMEIWAPHKDSPFLEVEREANLESREKLRGIFMYLRAEVALMHHCIAQELERS